MSAPCVTACSPWATRDDLPAKCADADDDVKDQALADATDILFFKSGQKWPGYCSDVVRPNGQSIFDMASRSTVRDVLRWDSWADRNWSGLCGCNHRIGEYGCGRLSEVSLGVWPVDRIEQVKVDGEVLDPSLYRVDDYQYLVRLPDPDGSNPGWKCCQRMDLAATEEGTFEVSVVYGTLPPNGGRVAAAALACQLIRSRSGEACEIPANVQSLTRQGVGMNIQSVVDLLGQGKTGSNEADRWLAAVNPTGQTRPGGVLIPGARSSVRRVGT